MSAGPPRSRTDVFGARTYDCRACAGRHPSVTTMISAGGPKPALVPWAAKMVAELAVAETDWRTMPPEEAIGYLKGAPNRKRDAAGDAGSAVHREIEAMILGRPRPEPPLPIRPHLEHFGRWCEANGPEWEAAEMTVHNCAYGYSGTLDAIAVVHGRRLLIDVKTGERHPYPEAALQLAAYRRARHADTGAALVPMPATDAAAVLRLTARGADLIEVDTSEEVFEAFLSIVAVGMWSRDLAKRVIGRPIRSEAEQIERQQAALAKYAAAGSR